ncbi:MAG: co-chaperone GroES [Betaproteobacteria bacterium]|jgi:co-chaperonin GroES (HSP10)|nr:co-chaperone GroES [Betaproteobacteria bacterium]
MKMNEPVACNDAEIAWAFPSVDPGAKPLGGRILVQIRRSKKKTTKGGIMLIEETKETEKWNTQVAKVIEIGSLAFRHRDSMKSWPEGSWCEVGDYIRVPKWGGDRWEVKVPGEDSNEDPALFMIINDHEVIAKITGNPLETRAFL